MRKVLAVAKSLTFPSRPWRCDRMECVSCPKSRSEMIHDVIHDSSLWGDIIVDNLNQSDKLHQTSTQVVVKSSSSRRQVVKSSSSRQVVWVPCGRAPWSFQGLSMHAEAWPQLHSIGMGCMGSTVFHIGASGITGFNHIQNIQSLPSYIWVPNSGSSKTLGWLEHLGGSWNQSCWLLGYSGIKLDQTILNNTAPISSCDFSLRKGLAWQLALYLLSSSRCWFMGALETERERRISFWVFCVPNFFKKLVNWGQYLDCTWIALQI